MLSVSSCAGGGATSCWRAPANLDCAAATSCRADCSLSFTSAKSLFRAAMSSVSLARSCCACTRCCSTCRTSAALFEVRGQARQGLLSLGSPLSQLLDLVARCRKLLLQRRLRFARLLDALLGLRRIRGFVCRFLGDARQLLARLAFLLTRGLQPLADVSQLLGARHHGLLIGRD